MKITIFFALAILFYGCTAYKQAQPTIFMNSQTKIQYYQEQVNYYNYLIEQEKSKIDKKK